MKKKAVDHKKLGIHHLDLCKECVVGACCREGVEVDLYEVAAILKTDLSFFEARQALSVRFCFWHKPEGSPLRFSGRRQALLGLFGSAAVLPRISLGGHKARA
jgi:hypothetical protein